MNRVYKLTPVSMHDIRGLEGWMWKKLYRVKRRSFFASAAAGDKVLLIRYSGSQALAERLDDIAAMVK